jgi:hypothetical protein
MSQRLNQIAKVLHDILAEKIHQRDELEWHPTIAELSAYRKNELSPKVKERIRDHLVLCLNCSDLLLVCKDSSDLQDEFEQFLDPAQDDMAVSESDFKEFWQEVTEAELLRSIGEGLPYDLEARYQVLAKKRDSESLATSEYDELLSLTERIEWFEVRRLEALDRLARLRGLSLRAVIEELGLKPSSNA